MSKRYYYLTPKDREIAEANGIGKDTLKARVTQLGWDIDRAITQKPRSHRKHHTALREKAEANGINAQAFWHRVNSCGWCPEKATTVPLMTREESNAKARLANQKTSPADLAIAKKNGVTPHTFRRRVKRGWSIEEARSTPPLSNAQCLEKARENSPFREINEMQFNLNTQQTERR